MSIEPTKIIGTVRTSSTTAPSAFWQAADGQAKSREIAQGTSVVASSDARDPGPAPIDYERVSEIRAAVERGTYPLVPAKLADAIIAAGMLLRSAK